MKFKARRELKKTRIEIIPMIDTMFFLLVFFMLSSLSLTHLNGLKVDLPQTATIPPGSLSKLMLTITKDKSILLNGRQIPKDSLQAEVANEISAQNLNLDTTSLIVNADADVPHGLVIERIDDCRAKGLTHFAIATTPKN